MKIEYEPIGVIRTPFDEPAGTPRNPADASGAEGRVEIDPALAPGLRDLDRFSHIILLFHFHRSEGWELELVPRSERHRAAGHKRGVFATRAPRRPNAIGLSVVRLERVEGNVLHVRDVDMIDGTPLLDIKPYLPSIDAHADADMGWLDEGAGTGIGPEGR